MNVVLVMFRENGERRSFSLTRDVTVIGRREDAHFRIPLTDVSRKHCRLVINGNSLFVEDLGSSNGTFHNGHRVKEAEIHPGDSLRIGPVQFVVQIDGVPSDVELGGIGGSGLADAAATVVTPAFTPPPPPPLPPGFAPPEPASAPTIDDTPEELAEDDVLIDDLNTSEPAGDAEPVTEPFFGEPSSAESDDELVAEDLPVYSEPDLPLEAEAGVEPDAEPEELSLELTDEEFAEQPEAEDLPDFETSPPTARPTEPTPEEVAAESLPHEVEPETEPGAPSEAAPQPAEPAAEEDAFAVSDEEASGEDAEDDVLIDFDLPDEPKH